MSEEFTGIKLGVPFKQYCESPGVNHSSAKEIDTSPKHYLQKITAAEDDPTPAQVTGKITHSAILESDFSGFVVRPKDMSFTTKEGKAWRDAQTKHIIDQETASDIAGMVTAVKNHPLADIILYKTDGNNEVSCWGKHRFTELVIKGRADRVTMDAKDQMTIVDVKTCGRGEASPESFSRDLFKYKYHSQASWYLDLFGASFFVFIVVEKEAPYAVACYNLDGPSIALGRELNDRRLAKIHECATSGKWPAYPEELRTINIPDWAIRKGN